MLFISQVTKSFGGQKLFDEADLQLNKNEKIGIVGRNGAGKSTLFKLLLGQDSLDTGEITYPDGYKIGGLSQHLEFTKPNIVEEVSQVLDEDQQHDVWRAEKLLSGLGFSSDDFKKPASEFSGGFQMRIKLAELLLSEPDLLLLDEPTNHLDILSIRWLEGFLKKWKGEILCISHDQQFLEKVMTHTAALHRKRFKKLKGAPHKIYAHIAQEEGIHEKTRKADEKDRARQEKFIREFRSGARSAGLVQSRIKMLDKREKYEALSPIPEIKFHFKEKIFEAARFLEARSLTFGYEKGQDLLKKLNFEVKPKDKIGIIGANGKGKSTLLKILNGELELNSGTIKGNPSTLIGYFGQSNVDKLVSDNSIIEELLLSGNVSEQMARGIAGNLLFSGGLAYKKVEILSGGEKARVNLGKILLSDINLLLLDEPTNHLDYESIEALIDAVNEFDGGVLFVAHDENFLRQVAKKLIVFDGDEVYFFHGSYDQFLREKGFVNEALDLQDGQIKKTKSRPLHKEQRKEKERQLRPLRRKLERVEKEILVVETKQKENKEEFDRHDRSGNRMQMHTLGIEYHDLQKEVTDLYKQWDTIAEQIGKVEEEFKEDIEE